VVQELGSTTRYNLAFFGRARAKNLLELNRPEEALEESVRSADHTFASALMPAELGGHYYDLACYCSLAAAEFSRLEQLSEGQRREKVVSALDRAMEMLRKAVQAGFKDADRLKKDTDLDPLDDREDFKKLIAELEKK
jgi:hypothetical protein